MKILCIGGCKDAQWIEDNNYDHTLVAVPTDPCYEYSMYDTDEFVATIEMNTETYRRESIRGLCKKFDVLVEEHLTPDDMIKSLIENYRSRIPLRG